MAQNRLAIRNWKKFQHFKDRRPPWIKLYRDLLDSHDWHKLDGETAKALVELWLLASETKEGFLPEVSDIAFRLRTTETKVKSILTKLSPWLVQADISATSERHQDGPSETETETETETESTWVSGDPPASTPPPLSLNGWGTPEALMALYNDSCPVECPAAETLSPKRKEMAKRILKAFPDKTYWVEAFAEVCKTPFLRGMCPPSKGHNKSFIANFDWFLSCSKSGVENVVSVWERKYGH